MIMITIYDIYRTLLCIAHRPALKINVASIKTAQKVKLLGHYLLIFLIHLFFFYTKMVMVMVAIGHFLT